jgi:hypothetical protein
MGGCRWGWVAVGGDGGWVLMCGMGGASLRSNIPRSALLATLDTYNFTSSKGLVFALLLW